MSTKSKHSGWRDGSHTEPGLRGGQSPSGPLKPLKSKAQTWLPLLRELLAYFSLFFLRESGSEVFRQDIIYVSVFQRHPMCKREREEGGKANIKTNLTRDRFLSLRLKNVYCSSYLLSPPALWHHYGALSSTLFSNDPNPGDPADVCL